MLLPANTISTYVGTWQLSVGFSRIFDTSEEMVAAVSDKLEAYGLLVQSSEFEKVFNIFTRTPFQVRLLIKNTVQYDSTELLSQVREAVKEVSGEIPISQSLPFVQIPGGSKKETGDVNPGPDKEKTLNLAGLLTGGVGIALVALVFVTAATIYSYRAR